MGTWPASRGVSRRAGTWGLRRGSAFCSEGQVHCWGLCRGRSQLESASPAWWGKDGSEAGAESGRLAGPQETAACFSEGSEGQKGRELLPLRASEGTEALSWGGRGQVRGESWTCDMLRLRGTPLEAGGSLRPETDTRSSPAFRAGSFSSCPGREPSQHRARAATSTASGTPGRREARRGPRFSRPGSRGPQGRALVSFLPASSCCSPPPGPLRPLLTPAPCDDFCLGEHPGQAVILSLMTAVGRCELECLQQEPAGRTRVTELRILIGWGGEGRGRGSRTEGQRSSEGASFGFINFFFLST